MGHAKKEDLQTISTLLEQLRTIEYLKEKSWSCFYLKSKGVLHFHTTAERFYADVWTGQTWVEIDVEAKPSAKLQKQIFLKISKQLVKD